jgi:2-oxoglutarate dehydrogenase E1 component
VSYEWRRYFDQLTEQMARATPDVSHEDIRKYFLELAKYPEKTFLTEGIGTYKEHKQERVVELIAAYRRLGHLQATIDPLGLSYQSYNPSLELSYYGFTDEDMQKSYNVASFTGLNKSTATLSEIYQSLRRIYCNTIGFEYMHINRNDEVEWIRQRIEQGWAAFKLTNDVKQHILERLVAADSFEKYLGFKYVGQKRFSLEGGDSLIPLLDTIINRSTGLGVKEIVIGMAHRGRLNVLINVLGKEPKELFDAFEWKGVKQTHSGDVKYHLGYSSNVKTQSGTVHLALAFNPSHLEIVSPVVQGSVRGRQRRRRDTSQQHVVPIQIHGDAAFAGQGVSY